MIDKLRAGMMPPAAAPGASRRGDAAGVRRRRSRRSIDSAAALQPEPGPPHVPAAEPRRVRARRPRPARPRRRRRRPSCRPTRSARASTTSPTRRRSRRRCSKATCARRARFRALAIGDRNAAPTEATYKVPRTESQMHHVDGAPWGTRGGACGRRTSSRPTATTRSACCCTACRPASSTAAPTRGEQIEMSINGQRVALLDDQLPDDRDRQERAEPHLAAGARERRARSASRRRSSQHVRRRRSTTCSRRSTTRSPTAQIGDGYGVTTLPHLRDFSITGPFKVTGVSDTPSRRRVFICRPTSAAEEAPCAERSSSGWRARRTAGRSAANDVKGLMAFYEQGRKGGDFEAGVRLALQAMLASPQFVFRFEEVPPTLRRRADTTGSATSTSRRACRSSSGTRRPTPSC